MVRLTIFSIFAFSLLGCAASSDLADRSDTAPADETDAEFGERILKSADYLAYIKVKVIEVAPDKTEEESTYTLSGFLFKHRNGKYYVGCAGHIKSSPTLQIKKILVWFKKNWVPFAVDLVGYDLDYDCSVLKPRDSNFYFNGRIAVLGDSSALQKNDRVATLGAPLGKPNQVRVGKILAPSDYVYSQRDKPVHVVVHDCQVQRGNSGGPVVNEKGEVIGIHVMSERLGNRRFAIPINDFKERLDDLINGFQRDHYESLNTRYYFDM